MNFLFDDVGEPLAAINPICRGLGEWLAAINPPVAASASHSPAC